MYRVLLMSCLLVAAGCQTARTPRPAEPYVATVAPVATVDAAAIMGRAELQVGDLLDLVHVHPRVVAAGRRVGVAAGAAEQRELRPNPSVGMEIEDLVLDDMEVGESTTWVGYRQPLVVGDRLSTARELGRSEVAAQEQELAVLVHQLQSQIRLVWVELAYLYERQVLLEALSAEVAEVRELLAIRIAGGAAAEAEMARVTVIYASLQGELQEAQRRLRGQHVRLQQWVGRRDLDPAKLRPVLAASPALPTGGDVDAHPQLLRAHQAVAVAHERLAHERALAVPDVEVGLSVGRNHGSDENLVELGVSVPWTLFDRRQGTIAAAAAEVSAAEALVDAVALELRVDAAALDAEVAGLHEALAAHDAEVAPAAAANYSQTVARFRAGKASVPDILDALRSRGDASRHRLELLREWHRASAEMANLTALSVPASSTDFSP